MEYQIREEDDLRIISCKGRMDAGTSSKFKEHLKNLIDEGFSRLVIDMEHVDFLDSSGLGTLVACLRRVKEKNGDIKISGLRPEVRSIFDMTRVSRLFDIYPDVTSACKAFKKL